MSFILGFEAPGCVVHRFTTWRDFLSANTGVFGSYYPDRIIGNPVEFLRPYPPFPSVASRERKGEDRERRLRILTYSAIRLISRAHKFLLTLRLRVVDFMLLDFAVVSALFVAYSLRVYRVVYIWRSVVIFVHFCYEIVVWQSRR
uniref:Uncharacterized protein n=1 Tax=Ananas comosus var. bracteatus TaxID=296719 RepID=A0A6V7PEH4_ANACO|nr:unnamed protein product [Ananas comosus var. bracteatus]